MESVDSNLSVLLVQNRHNSAVIFIFFLYLDKTSDMFKVLCYLQLTCLLALTASAKGSDVIDLGPVYAPHHASAEYYVSEKRQK